MRVTTYVPVAFLRNFRYRFLMSLEYRHRKETRIEPSLPGGFRDYGPEDAIARDRMVAIIKQTFTSFGFDPLETPAAERTEVLTGGEEDSGKIIFNLKGSRAEKESSVSLRFDLTVPLARFVAAHPEIPKPFKRYQIGNVWRGESPQAGRYREFMQADVDIVGSSLPDADAEIISIIYGTLKNLGVEKFKIKINNRQYLDMLPECAQFHKKDLWDILRILDKHDKIGKEAALDEVAQRFSVRIAHDIKSFLLASPLSREYETGELHTITNRLIKEYEIENRYWEFDTWMVRGLSYYTGTIFETILDDAPEIGSIFSGGRYDDLVSRFTGQKIPAVGASLGVDRLFAAMEEMQMSKKKSTLTEVLILNLGLSDEYPRLAKELREHGINVALWLGDDTTMQAQLAYALKKEIPYVLIYGSDEASKKVVAIKNLQTREQKEIPRDQLTGYFQK
ncbi:MAG: histidyl-tRNA synthetase [Parcubacteria group bacterium Gr01-1014_66]|nr:MAG: histidyl-tRNA synthetase [Parcubacteria group bacterium Gr01-1014_66]